MIGQLEVLLENLNKAHHCHVVHPSGFAAEYESKKNTQLDLLSTTQLRQKFPKFKRTFGCNFLGVRNPIFRQRPINQRLLVPSFRNDKNQQHKHPISKIIAAERNRWHNDFRFLGTFLWYDGKLG